MLKKLIFLSSLFLLTNVYGQNSNVKTVSAPANVASSASNRATPTPRPRRTPTPRTAANSTIELDSVAAPEIVYENSTIRGRVYYEDTGRAVRRAVVNFFGKGPRDGGREYSTITDNEGNFELKKVRAGTYFPMINAPGVVSFLAYVDLSKSRNETFDVVEKYSQTIVVNGINDIEVQIPAKRGGAVSGRVIYSNGDPAIGVKVEILRKGEEGFSTVIPNFSSLIGALNTAAGAFQTDDRGVYRFSGLPDGEYIVRVVERVNHGKNKERSYNDPFSEMIFPAKNSFLTIFYPDVFEVEKAEKLLISSGQEVSEINLTIPDRQLQKVVGKVVLGKDKLPIAGARVLLKKTKDIKTIFEMDNSPRFSQYILTNEDGTFEFGEIPEGEYKLTIEKMTVMKDLEKQKYSNIYSEYKSSPVDEEGEESQRKNTILQNLSKKTSEIKIENTNIENLIIEITEGAEVSGVIEALNLNSFPSNLKISLRSEESLTEQISSQSAGKNPPREISKNRTSFEFKNIADGKYFLDISDESGEFYVKNMMVNGKNLLAQPLEIVDGKSIGNIQVILGNDVGTLTGKMTGNKEINERRPIVLFLVPTDKEKRQTMSLYKQLTPNEKGEFTVKLPPIEYGIIYNLNGQLYKNSEELQKWLDEQMKDAQKVSIEAGRTSDISIQMK